MGVCRICQGGGGVATRGIATRLLEGFGVLEHIFINFLLSKSLKISFLYKNNYKL